MTPFRFRVLRPRLSEWIEREGSSVEDAIQSYHDAHVSFGWVDNSASRLVKNLDGTVKEKQCFALFELEDGSELISRICLTGIWRKGGTQRRTIADVAKELGVSIASLENRNWQDEDYQCG